MLFLYQKNRIIKNGIGGDSMLLGVMLSATLFGIGVSCVFSYQMFESYKLNTCSKYDGCEMKDFNPNDHLPVEELKQQIDYQRIKLLLPYLKKIRIIDR